MKNKVLSETKFKYDCLNNRLSRINPNNLTYSYQIPEESQFTANFGGQGFILGENSWIIFTIYANKIRAFAKLSQSGLITYYRRDFARADIVSFQFTEEDIVVKNEKGWWVPKEK